MAGSGTSGGGGPASATVPWEIWMFGGLGFGGALATTVVTVEPAAGSMPEVGDLLPWWMAAGLFSSVTFLGLLGLVARFSRSKKERKRVAHIAGILQPLASVTVVGAGSGVALGWAGEIAMATNQPEALYAVLFPPLGICLLGVPLLLVRGAWLKAWSRRLNP